MILQFYWGKEIHETVVYYSTLNVQVFKWLRKIHPHKISGKLGKAFWKR